MKFLTKSDVFDKEVFEAQKKKYLDLAKDIDEYTKRQFTDWQKEIMGLATENLKQKILTPEGGKYRVNFSEQFKLLIKEAKHLEKMGYPISKTIINISLQEKEYLKYIDKLQIMLREYHEAVETLTDVEKILFKYEIKKLNDHL